MRKFLLITDKKIYNEKIYDLLKEAVNVFLELDEEIHQLEENKKKRRNK